LKTEATFVEGAFLTSDRHLWAEGRPMNAPSSSSDREPLELLAAEFLDRRRRGEDASPAEYAERHAELADQILEFFAALEVVGVPPGRCAAGSPGRRRLGPRP
jgi:hypothetical protein